MANRLESEPEGAAVVESPVVEPEPAIKAPAADEPQPEPEPEPVEPAPAAEPAAEAPSGTAYLDHDDPNASASFNGVELVRDVEGLFLVPLHAVEQLLAHGFRLIRGA